jgi:ABC-type uncharacterized transport system permease subunit
MNSTLFGSLAILTYIASTIVTFRSLWIDYGTDLTYSRRRTNTLVLGWLAVSLHGLALVHLSMGQEGLNFSFLSALASVSWVIVAIVLVTAFFKPVDKLGIMVFPLAALILLLKLGITEETHLIRNHAWPMTLHIIVSMLAYCFLNIAAIQAILLAFQDWRLRTHHSNAFLVRSLPPLQTMESLLFQLLTTGFLLLSISLASGFIFLENMFAQHLAHKTILSIVAWLVFAIVLLGRLWYGWRGQMAIRWTLGGFFTLMLAYFGSKMVLEWILNRS